MSRTLRHNPEINPQNPGPGAYINDYEDSGKVEKKTKGKAI